MIAEAAVIARKELVSTLRDGRIVWSAAIFAVMLLVAMASAAQRYSVISAERSAAQAVVEEQFRNQGSNIIAKAATNLFICPPLFIFFFCFKFFFSVIG